jgi:hypothetical protein
MQTVGNGKWMVFSPSQVKGFSLEGTWHQEHLFVNWFHRQAK